jgi:hypothetical protein
VRAVCRGGLQHPEDPMRNVKTAETYCESWERKYCFTPCTGELSLLEETSAAVNGYWLSRACSSFGRFRYHQVIDEALYNAEKTTGGGALVAHHNPDGKNTTHVMADRTSNAALTRVFLRENPGANNRTQLDLNERTRPAPRQ